MMNNEFLVFLFPDNESIQLLFGGVMIAFVLGTILFSLCQAGPKYWEGKWQGKKEKDGKTYLDVEHGSLSEISEAVESPSEKIADIMPGILLILGLLGTFLGLGIALNKASNILIDANSSGMDNAMANLMGMMDGLGTKFKTSTWGICAFLFLRFWFAVARYDDKRLRWCAQKMKYEFEQSRQNIRIEREQSKQHFLDALKNISDSMQRGSVETCQVLEKTYSGMEGLLKKLVIQGEVNEEQNESRNNQQEKLISTLVSIQQQMLNSSKMQSEQYKLQLGELTMTREWLQRFIDASSDNLSAIQRSAKEMSEAAQGMGNSADNLQKVIGDFRTGVSDMLDTVKSDLGGTISHMGDSFSQNMSAISASMSSATDGISESVSNLSENVGAIMKDMEDSIQKSNKIQGVAQREFMVISELLSEKVQAMTKLVEDLREQIVSGLAAVSKSNREVAHLNTRYADITEHNATSAEEIRSLVEQLKTMQQISPLQPEMKLINDGIYTLINNIERLSDNVLNNDDASVALASIDERLISSIKELSGIREKMVFPDQERLVQQIEQNLKPLSTTLKNIDQTLASMSSVNDVA